MPGFHAGRTDTAAGVRRRFAPHQLGHAHAVEMAREGVPLQGIDNAEIIDAVHARRAPMIPVSASLRLGRSWAGTSLVARRRSRRVWGRGLMAQWRGATALAFVVRFMLRA
jgi:hypothetical protein